MNLLQKYSYYLARNPLRTKMTTSGTIAFFGDIMCQYMENSIYHLVKFNLEYQITKDKQKWNWTRTRNFTLMGTFFSAPLLHLHFSKLLPWVSPQMSMRGCVKKLFVDQLIVAPLFMAGWFTAISFIDGKPFRKSMSDLKLKFVPTMIANWQVWPAVNLCNFYFVPIHYQVLFANMVSLFFNAYLSYMHNSYQAP